MCVPHWGLSGGVGVGAIGDFHHSLMKAMRRKAELNLEPHGMDTSSKSFLSFSSPSIYSKLNSVGIKMGSSKNQIDVSTRVLKRMEFDRLTFISKA